MSNIGYGFKPKATASRLPPNTIACKCQMSDCNCGVHKCPADQHLFKLTPYEQDALRTSYQQNYPAHPQGPVPRRDDHRPKQEMHLGDQPFEGITTCQSDFKPPQANPARPARPPVGDPSLINGGNNTRSFQSENRQAYDPKGYVKRESFHPASTHTTKLPFDGASTNSQHFRGVQGKPSTPFKESPTIGGQREDRDFQSEAALKFVQHSDQRRTGFAPAARAHGTVPFEGQSTNSLDYRGVASPPAKLLAPQQSHAAEKETRDFLSSNAAQFQPKGYQVRESYKPQPDRSAAAIPFDAQSTNKTTYTGAAGERTTSMRPRGGLTSTVGAAIGSPDDRAWVSENRGQFDSKGYQARPSYHPTSTHTTSGPFEAASMSSTAYRGVQGKPSTPFKESPTISNQPESRDFATENSLKFVPHSDQRRTGFAPAPRAHGTVPFEGQSTNSLDYRPWTREGCPAMEIPDFENHKVDKDGHKMLSNHTGQWQPHVAQPR